MEHKELYIKENFIKLDSALKLANIAVTGGHAKIIIQNGEVKVNGQICTMRGKKLYIDDTAEFNGKGFIIKNAGN